MQEYRHYWENPQTIVFLEDLYYIMASFASTVWWFHISSDILERHTGLALNMMQKNIIDYDKWSCLLLSTPLRVRLKATAISGYLQRKSRYPLRSPHLALNSKKAVPGCSVQSFSSVQQIPYPPWIAFRQTCHQLKINGTGSLINLSTTVLTRSLHSMK